MKDTVCPLLITKQVSTNKLTKEELLKQINILEVKASVYSETDWDAYNRVSAELKNLDMILLDMYNEENEAFLQTNKEA